jgi:hypothetical protein
MKSEFEFTTVATFEVMCVVCGKTGKIGPYLIHPGDVINQSPPNGWYLLGRDVLLCSDHHENIEMKLVDTANDNAPIRKYHWIGVPPVSEKP